MLILKMKFKNTKNNYIEEVSSLSWLWCFLFGFIYFAIKGIWRHAIVSLVLAFVTFGISWFIYPFFIKSIIRKDYLRRGWKELKDK